MWYFYGKLVNRLPLCFRHPNRFFCQMVSTPWRSFSLDEVQPWNVKFLRVVQFKRILLNFQRNLFFFLSLDYSVKVIKTIKVSRINENLIICTCQEPSCTCLILSDFDNSSCVCDVKEDNLSLTRFLCVCV